MSENSNKGMQINPEEFGFGNYVRIISSFSPKYNSMLVPERFSKRVLCHVLSLYIDSNHFFMPPVFLAINGNAGEGKTSQAVASCIQKGINVIYISGTSLSGNHESDSKNKLEEVYNRACQLKEQGHVLAIIIDDFHKSVANEDKSVTRTINSNLLTGYMMNLAEQTGHTQIPIILTANDLSDVYAPLLRLGRADIFDWNPQPDEKKCIIRSILDMFATFSSDKEFDSFFAKYSSESIAFFSQLKNRYRLNLLDNYIDNIDQFDISAIASINNKLHSSMCKISIKELTALAKEQKLERNNRT